MFPGRAEVILRPTCSLLIQCAVHQIQSYTEGEKRSLNHDVQLTDCQYCRIHTFWKPCGLLRWANDKKL